VRERLGAEVGGEREERERAGDERGEKELGEAARSDGGARLRQRKRKPRMANNSPVTITRK
jgi:hypothetical protein